ncbi:phosphate ABC transporter permease PstA [Kineosporiaceae bacterium SCSIO 59966]|nr:phosphate ABC transporter permease PstA [Kineosporiaceae bacterium SCSIO 59966]
MTVSSASLTTSTAMTQATLPRWVVPGLIGASAAAGFLLWLLGLSAALAAVLAVLLLGVAVPLASRAVEGPRRATDRFLTIVVSVAFSLAILPLLSLIITVVQNGIGRFDLQFFTWDMRGVLGEGGGAYHAIVGTLLVTGAAAVISVPVGVMAAVYLVEYGHGRLARGLTVLVDVMTGIPSIVAGLFAYAFFALFFGPSIRFGFGGAVALSVLMIPIVVRSVEEMLKLVPNELREAAYALGVPKWRTIVKVVLPTAAAGIATGVTIAVARVIGETAPLLIIAGSTNGVNWDLFDARMSTLPVYTYYSYTIPGIPPEFGIERAWAAALTLFVIVMGLNLIARLISRVFGVQAR